MRVGEYESWRVGKSISLSRSEVESWRGVKLVSVWIQKKAKERFFCILTAVKSRNRRFPSRVSIEKL